MPDNALCEEVLRAVEACGTLRNARRVADLSNHGAHILEGEAAIGDQQVTIQLLLDNGFPLQLPRFRLLPWDALGFIPHVTPDGLVCFTASEGLVMNRRQPTEIALESLARAIGVLSDGVTGNNRRDFVDEFEAYWVQLPNVLMADSMLNVTDQVDEVIIAIEGGKGETRLYIGHDQCEIDSFFNGRPITQSTIRQSGLYLPLEPGTVFTPPRPDRPFWTVEEAQNLLVESLSKINRTRLLKLTKKRTRVREYVIISLPRPAGGVTLFGLRYDGVGAPHPLQNKGQAERLFPLSITRRDRGFLVQRGGGTLRLDNKRVLLAGCGALGGHLAFELVRAGVLNLTLVDSDILTAENTYRHTLGRQHWGSAKAAALKQQIEEQFPYVQVTAIRKRIEEAVADGTVELAKYDLAVFALGNPTVELDMNERLSRMPGGPPALFTWLEPLGIGGHALLTHNEAGRGCLECLYTSGDGDGLAYNRAAFAAAGQDFRRALSGCGSLYTPYGSADALRTAALAAQLAIDVLTGREAWTCPVDRSVLPEDGPAPFSRLCYTNPPSRSCVSGSPLSRPRGGFVHGRRRACRCPRLPATPTPLLGPDPA